MAFIFLKTLSKGARSCRASHGPLASGPTGALPPLPLVKYDAAEESRPGPYVPAMSAAAVESFAFAFVSHFMYPTTLEVCSVSATTTSSCMGKRWGEFGARLYGTATDQPYACGHC